MEAQLVQSDIPVVEIVEAGPGPVQALSLTENRARNRAVAQCWYQAFDRGDPAQLEAIIANEWFDIPAPPGQRPGAGGAIGSLKRLRAAFPDLRVAIRDVLQEGDKVVVRSEVSGTHCGPLLGLTPSSRTIRIQAVDIHEVRDGKIIRTWHTEDWMSGLRQLGFFQQNSSLVASE